MKDKKPVNVLKSIKIENAVIDSSMLISVKAYKSSYNLPSPFFKPISKIV